MKPQDDYRNGDGGSGSGSGSGSRSRSGSSSSSASGEPADELWLRDDAAPARVLSALNSLRKARQHYDVLLLAGGAELPAHRAVLAAASPYLLHALQETPAGEALRVEGVDAEALGALVEFAYSGQLRACEPAAARRVYRAACTLRVEAVRAPLAERLLRAVEPALALKLRALPGLQPDQLRQLDDYIARNFEEICSCGALASLPVINVSLLRESSASDGEESAAALADAALAWLRHYHPDADVEALSARAHLLYVDARGALRDCGQMPRGGHEAPELADYRREAERRARAEPAEPAAPNAAAPDAADWAVLAARGTVGGGARALVALGGRLAGVRAAWSAAGAGGAARGGVLGAGAAAGDVTRLAPMAAARCALGAAAVGGRLVAAGGYDRARVHADAESYDPQTNTWTGLARMRGPRARFPSAALGGRLLAVGGSDGLADLASVDELVDGAWRPLASLPLARTYAAAAADERRHTLLVVGGLAAGHSLRRVDALALPDTRWSRAPDLITGRSQCAGVVWEDALWVLGGCDAWHCLASTERLRLGEVGGDEAGWVEGPPLPSARRSAGAVVWRGLLLVAGGSDGAASLRRTDWLAAPDQSWRVGPALTRARAGLALAVLDDALYAAGGYDGKHFLACLECLYQPDGQWTTIRAAAPPPAPPPATPPATADAPPDEPHS